MSKPKNPLRDAGTGRAPRLPIFRGIQGITIHKPKLPAPGANGGAPAIDGKRKAR